MKNVSTVDCRRRNTMTGSLRERNGKYHVVLNFKDEGGKWKQKCISTGLEIRGNKKKLKNF